MSITRHSMLNRVRQHPVVVALVAVLLLGLVSLLLFNERQDRCQMLTRGADTVARYARQWHIDWLEDLACRKWSECFDKSLALGVRRGELAIVAIPALPGLDPDMRFVPCNDHGTVTFHAAFLAVMSEPDPPSAVTGR